MTGLNNGNGLGGKMSQDIAEHDATGEEIFLTCIVCGQIEVINITQDRKLPLKVYWECMNCRKDEDSDEFPMRASDLS
jgi:hypothetical protein